MNLKKAILASMIVSSMLVAVAGPIAAGAEAAQAQKQTDNKKVQIDQKLAAKWSLRLPRNYSISIFRDVKWDNLFKDYYFVKGKEKVLQAALDAESDRANRCYRTNLSFSLKLEEVQGSLQTALEQRGR
ncbi:hypothetical protein M3661_12835 [Paenibacillus sp. MER 180]|uniref:hypothetical protein n=1 Tax=Paenibacillus sp. MER 180 TaxID=2939570 RepID=UPI00203E4BD6|nr:hypothetical protein [Paenibacillus sp. MER 180]MCM3291012.1 hypothetical protein [Paenibacillus sp. MER 180]